MASNAEGLGFANNFVDDVENYVCAFCLLVARDTVQISVCGHSFCRTCWTEWTRSKGRLVCPVDNTVVDRNDIFPDRKQDRLTRDLKVFCENKENGCTETPELRNIEDHQKICKYQIIPCALLCGEKLLLWAVDRHMENECQLRMRHCEICSVDIFAKDFSQHQSEEITSLKEENKTVREGNVVLTDKCEEMKDKNDSLREKSDMLEGKNSDLKNHIEKLEQGKIDMESTNEKLQENSSELEEKINTLERENEKRKDTNEILQNDNSGLKEANGTLEEKNSELVEKIITLESENEKRKEINENLQDENSNLQETVGRIEEKNSQLEQKIITLESANDIIKETRPNELGENIIAQENEKVKTEVANETLAMEKNNTIGNNNRIVRNSQIVPTYTPIISWMVKAKRGIMAQVYSAPFYTQSNYRMCLGVGPCDWGSIVIATYLMKGQYDDVVEWPWNEEKLRVFVNRNGMKSECLLSDMSEQNRPETIQHGVALHSFVYKEKGKGLSRLRVEVVEI